MLVAHPERARNVRTLCLHPDDGGPFATRMWGRGALFNGYAISAAIRKLASKMEILHSFTWDGEELPPYDDMWFALRVLYAVKLATPGDLAALTVLQLSEIEIYRDVCRLYPDLSEQSRMRALYPLLFVDSDLTDSCSTSSTFMASPSPSNRASLRTSSLALEVGKHFSWAPA